ncbi:MULTISPECIES: hypothetical protein [Acinetobacter]|uniref:hypothetical protein n=1 Tax=Acinetobacter TaxID=469 RepID=UPI00039F8050|nr:MULTISPECIES: hypothetical protein [Acinetobacter]MDQ9817370.1 hypothetical protein [Acinetobacter bereziniae]MDR3030432.1 hypothetical protein [Acinetobacter sp.]BCX71870.1 hypothetical protein TOL5_00700 [Acinetobacter sp. Tol 5]
MTILAPAHAQQLSCQQDYPKIIAPDLQRLGQDLKNNDYSFMQQKTHPSLINYVGGPENYQKLLKYAQNMFAESKLEIQKVESNPPLYSYIVDQEEICFVPKTITMKVAGKTVKAPPSFMVAIRSQHSHQWTYLDGSGLQKNPKMLFILFPNFPKNVKVPF